MNGIKIREIEVVRGSVETDNTPYIGHFKERGKEVEHLLRDIMGRDKRFLYGNRENGLTLAIDVSEKVLAKSGLKGSDIDMIVYSSQLPEFVAPPSSILVHNAIGGKSECTCYDINANCAGLVIAIDQVSRNLFTNPKAKRALIIGSDSLNLTVSEENELCYGVYGDASCAVILEKTDEVCGLIDTNYYTNSIENTNIRFPACGFSNLYRATAEEMKTNWVPFKCYWMQNVVDNMQKLLAENNLCIDDISMFCLSQLSINNVEFFRDKLGVPPEKSLYIGDSYGYTGTSSPIIVFYEALKKGLIKRGDYVILWTVGAGTQNTIVLLQY